MFKFILALLLIFPSFVMADEWTTADTEREVAYLVIDSVDWAQTRNIARNPDKWREQNNFFNDHPSVKQVDICFVTTNIAHAVVAYLLPSDYRSAFQYLTIGYEIGWINHNYKMGISAKF